MAQAEPSDLLIVGAGFAGLYMLHRARGLGLTARVLEAGGGVGGTWYWNRYPGARCDVESMQYSFSFDEELQQSWRWSEKYAPQPEILRYANHVADRFDLRRDILLDTRVAAARFDADRRLWCLETGDGRQFAGRFCVMATGCLSVPKLPEVPGVSQFRGATYHTGAWPHEAVDFSGQRVAVIGTGSSAIQSIPVIAAQARHLTVFQRTPNYSVPARNVPLDPDYERAWKSEYAERRHRARQIRTGILYGLSDKSALDVSAAEREAEFESRWRLGGLGFMAAFSDLILNAAANDTAADFVRAKIRGIVRDEATAEALVPTDYPIGTKRICVDTDYYETFNRPNVALVNLRQTPLAAVTELGVRTSEAEYEADSIVFATGFDAMTGALARIAVTGRDGQMLAEKWRSGPRTHLGLTVAGFPNLFLVTGPGSPSVLSNMMVSIEQHVDWIAALLAHMANSGRATVEAEQAAEDEWVGHVSEVAHRTLYPRANSWYMGANVPGKPRVFLPYIGGVPVYRQRCEEVARSGYPGFRII